MSNHQKGNKVMKYDPKEAANPHIQLPTPQSPFVSYIDYDSPISARENYKLAMHGKAEWIPTSNDVRWFCPVIIPDNPARAFVIEGQKYTGPVGGKDMFGVEWEYVPSAAGSIVRPGNPTITDISKWKEIVKFPNLDDWDWEGSAKANEEYLKNCRQYVNLCVFTGFFERLIAFMDFGPAAYAIMNKAQKPYVKEFFEALSDFWVDLVEHAAKYYGNGIDGFTFHDDWGAQHSPFFNARVVNEMLVPYMKKVTDKIHELGYTCELHSCGHLLNLVQCIEAAGWDTWQGMTDINDYHDVYGNLTSKLMMWTPAGNIKGLSKEETEAKAKAFVDEFGNKERSAVLTGSMPDNPDFYIEVYKLSRMKFGA